MDRTRAGEVEREAAAAAAEVLRDSTLEARFNLDFDTGFEAFRLAFTFKVTDLARATGRLAAFFAALGFAFALVAICRPVKHQRIGNL